MKKNEMTIAEIYEELGTMGYGVKLEVLAQMTPSELRKFLKKVRKAYNLVNELDNRINELESLLTDSSLAE